MCVCVVVCVCGWLAVGGQGVLRLEPVNPSIKRPGQTPRSNAPVKRQGQTDPSRASSPPGARRRGPPSGRPTQKQEQATPWAQQNKLASQNKPRGEAGTHLGRRCPDFLIKVELEEGHHDLGDLGGRRGWEGGHGRCGGAHRRGVGKCMMCGVKQRSCMGKHGRGKQPGGQQGRGRKPPGGQQGRGEESKIGEVASKRGGVDSKDEREDSTKRGRKAGGKRAAPAPRTGKSPPAARRRSSRSCCRLRGRGVGVVGSKGMGQLGAAQSNCKRTQQ